MMAECSCADFLCMWKTEVLVTSWIKEVDKKGMKTNTFNKCFMLYLVQKNNIIATYEGYANLRWKKEDCNESVNVGDLMNERIFILPFPGVLWTESHPIRECHIPYQGDETPVRKQHMKLAIDAKKEDTWKARTMRNTTVDKFGEERRPSTTLVTEQLESQR